MFSAVSTLRPATARDTQRPSFFVVVCRGGGGGITGWRPDFVWSAKRHTNACPPAAPIRYCHSFGTALSLARDFARFILAVKIAVFFA